MATARDGVRTPSQLRRFARDVQRMAYGHPIRYLAVGFGPMPWVLAFHRFDRAMYLRIGERWSMLRVVMLPLRLLAHPWIGCCEISYRADIGGGFAVLHCGLGVVIPSGVTIGEDVVFTGGNCIGRRARGDDFTIGDRVVLGANSSVIGPLHIGADVQVGAGAVVIHDFAGPGSLVGVPAHPVATTDEQAVASSITAGSIDD